ncbi:MAG: molecular chaperone HtpG [Planctomycetota bacterium]
MATATEKQEFSFQAEIKQLLHLLAHSLYQSKEIAIRELVSNASDALDKMRFVSLTDPAFRDAGTLEIVLDVDKDNKLLTIRDNGIGMTHDEAVKNLGTIAHSGSLEFLRHLSGDAKKDVSLIGQFGVGFYSAFMLADRVRVRTRSYKENAGWEWESDGTGRFTVTPVEGLDRGTSVVLHLKEDVTDLLEEHRLKGVLRKYSSFVPHPIRVGEDKVNDQKPIWVEPKSQLTKEQYDGFYQHLTHRSNEKPLWHLHFSADSPIQFHALVYCPESNIELLGFGRQEHGLYLCAKRILVQNECRDVVPEYLRFLYGLVDSEDLPLNVSRETLQDNSVLRKIRALLTKKVLDRLHEISKESEEEYLKFYRQFGATLKEGIGTDFENRERIARLLRFTSTASDTPGTVTSLDQYIARCPENQKQIYYIGGPDLAALRKSPNLEIFKKRGLEVLFLTDPIDEFIMANLREYEKRPLTSIDSADLDLPDVPESEAKEEKKEEAPASGFGKVLTIFRSALDGKVEDVRESKRLTDSPCCLVSSDGGMSTQMQKLLKLANKDFEISKKILEINPSSPLIRRLSSLASNSDHDSFIAECGRQLFSNAMLLEGFLSDPQDTVARVQEFMEQAAEKRSPIIF